MENVNITRRIRRTHFSVGVQAAGVSSYTLYNRMLLPAEFGGFVEDYHHLKKHVQIWDVACERQIDIQGPDAARLMDLISPRDMRKMADDQCYYIPVINRQGRMLNDPVAIKLATDHFWISIADGDFIQYVMGVSDALGLDVTIHEPDVSPLAIQGPKSDDLMARVFGNEVRDIRFFRYKRLSFEGHEMLVARSGYSKQGGFEIYVEGSEYAMPLWDRLMSAGEDLQVRVGCPNLIERIEGGLLSYGNDMNRDNTPNEVGLVKFCNSPLDYIGKAAVEAERKTGPSQQIRAIAIDGSIPFCETEMPLLAGGKQIGQVTSAVFSPDFGTNVAIGMVANTHWDAGTKLQVKTPDGMRSASVQNGFWI